LRTMAADLNDLSAFAAVARAGGFRDAAAKAERSFRSAAIVRNPAQPVLTWQDYRAAA
jgi:hypothetical protein